MNNEEMKTNATSSPAVISSIGSNHVSSSVAAAAKSAAAMVATSKALAAREVRE